MERPRRAAGTVPGMQQGTVAWFNAEKGYGFLAVEDGGEVFVHWTAIEGDGYRTLDGGQRVVFDTVAGTDGRLAAALVRPV